MNPLRKQILKHSNWFSLRIIKGKIKILQGINNLTKPYGQNYLGLC
jgi:hypothetical protein